MAATIEITACPIHERFRKGDFAIHQAEQAKPFDMALPKTFGLMGDCPQGAFVDGVTYRLYGSWDKPNKYGQTFRYNSFCPVTPHDKRGIIAYLQLAPHIGPVTAELLWDEFQGDAVRVVREDPELAGSVIKRFNAEQAKEASESLRRMKAEEHVTIDLMTLFEGRGFGKACIKQAIAFWGEQAPSLLRRDPFKSLRMHGVGYAKADRFYLDLGKPADRLKRQALCLNYHVQEITAKEGHIWVAEERAIEKLRESIGATEVRPEKTLKLATRARLLQRRVDPAGVAWLADAVRAKAEEFCVNRIIDSMYFHTAGSIMPEWENRQTTIEHKVDHTRCTRCHRRLTAATVKVLGDLPYGPECITRVAGGELAESVSLEEWLSGQTVTETIASRELVGATRVVSPLLWPRVSKETFPDLSDHQREQLSIALSGPIGILGGIPGTGKTYCLTRLVAAIAKTHGIGQITVMAPTGKAAQRVREVMAEAQIAGIAPSTIHRGLVVEEFRPNDCIFQHNEANPLDCQFMIIEEFSMVGIGLLRSILAAASRGCHVLFVGDVNQLTPVECGAPLRDMIRAGVPNGQLTQIFRNSGTIVKTCRAIVKGQQWQADAAIDLKREDPCNLILVPAGRSMAPMVVESVLRDLQINSPFDPVWDTQVVVAVNKKSSLARTTLNAQIQRQFNHNESGVKSPFWDNDKVICLKNSQLMLAEKGRGGEWRATDEKVSVSNGDMGRVVKAYDNKTIIDFTLDGKAVRTFVPRGTFDAGEDAEAPATGCDIDLAYAVTCHKLQGSQSPVIIGCLDDYQGATGQFGVCDRSWLYTMISRAQKLCILVGMMSTANEMASKTFIQRRKTFMAEDLAAMAEKAGVKLICEWW